MIQPGEQRQLEQDDMHLLQTARSPSGGMQEKDQCQSTLPGLEW